MTKPWTSSNSTVEGWTREPDHFVDVANVSGQEDMPYFRLGIRSVKGQGQAALQIEAKPIWSRSLSTRWRRIDAQKNNLMFHPLTQPLRTDNIERWRGLVSVEAASTSSPDFSVVPYCEQTDTPEDATSWSNQTLLTGVQTGPGMKRWGFTAFTTSKAFVRFGLRASVDVGPGTEVTPGVARLTIDVQGGGA